MRRSRIDNLESAALVQTALAHLLNAEAEKIQKAVSISDNLDELLKVNRSVYKTLIGAIHMEQTLYHQLDSIGDEDASWDAGEPVSRQKPEKPPSKPNPAPCAKTRAAACMNPRPVKACKRVFSAATEYRWNGGSTLYLREESDCLFGIKLCRIECDTFIMLPAGKRYMIETALELTNLSPSPVSAVLILSDEKGSPQRTQSLFEQADRYRLKDYRTVIWETPARGRYCLLSVRLLSSSGVRLETGRITVSVKRDMAALASQKTMQPPIPIQEQAAT
ncbi:MAG: hypothetical protein LBR85_02560 [Oscillospiraceae bacterium]|jgi:hypothetical protein|nr:hypothetical protein [Oscillospiraceae bacterium]